MEKLHKILLVDDDTITNFMNERLLKKLNISEEVKVSINGLEALNYIKDESSSKECPELIFLDINMPVMNGIEFLESFKDCNCCERKPVVVILTTSSDPGDLDKISNFPFVGGFLNKPLTEQKIQDICSKHFVA